MFCTNGISKCVCQIAGMQCDQFAFQRYQGFFSKIIVAIEYDNNSSQILTKADLNGFRFFGTPCVSVKRVLLYLPGSVVRRRNQVIYGIARDMKFSSFSKRFWETKKIYFT